MTDSYGRNVDYLRLSVTSRCNLRCRYCVPDQAPSACGQDLLSDEELLRIVRAAADIGVTKLRITGGEPLVRKGLPELCRRIAGISGIREICLTTNGTLLPFCAAALKDSGVTRLNISLDTLDPRKYRLMTRCGTLEDALRGIDAAQAAGFENTKINTVLIGGWNDAEAPRLLQWAGSRNLELRFIELMPMTGPGIFSSEAYIPCSRLLPLLPPLSPLPSEGTVARRFSTPQGFTVGFITPLSQSFCSQCRRLRLTAEGALKPCLHTSREIPLRGLSDEAMREAFLQALREKPLCHPALSSRDMSASLSRMNHVGG